MGTITDWLMILGGGYVILEILGINPLSMIESVLGINTTAATTTAATTSPQASTATSVSSTTNTLALVAAAAQAGRTDPTSLQTVSVWNYYYAAVRGIPGPAGLAVNGAQQPVGYLCSIQDWWTAMQAAGFSGFGYNNFGLGVIANRVNPYANPQGTPFRQNLIPTGYEKRIVKIGS
jgi:hypothetical protein